jgi:hypothetical protein
LNQTKGVLPAYLEPGDPGLGHAIGLAVEGDGLILGHGGGAGVLRDVGRPHLPCTRRHRIENMHEKLQITILKCEKITFYVKKNVFANLFNEQEL